VAVEHSELRLVWPPDLFAAEASALLGAGADDLALAGLLAEAFHANRAVRLLQQIERDRPHREPSDLSDPWGGPPHPGTGPFKSRATAQLVRQLANEAAALPRHAPRPLFSQRQRPPIDTRLTFAQVKDRVANAIVELTTLGYFEDAFGSECSDSRDNNPAGEGQRILAERLDDPDRKLWPLHWWSDGVIRPNGVHTAWPDEVFLDVIEALDELVARPRQQHWSSDGGDGGEWAYADYVRSAGQAVYRWRVNELLDRSEVPLRLAHTGSDAGLLVHSAGDPRDDMVDQVLGTPVDADRVEVEHAVALFRARTSTRETKRSAVVALARLLGGWCFSPRGVAGLFLIIPGECL
jgi:hypothetical protein